MFYSSTDDLIIAETICLRFRESVIIKINGKLLAQVVIT